jgi:hypothetical protein
LVKHQQESVQSTKEIWIADSFRAAASTRKYTDEKSDWEDKRIIRDMLESVKKFLFFAVEELLKEAQVHRPPT